MGGIDLGLVGTLIVYGANPVASNPDQRRVRRVLARDDLFTVVMEQFPTDTVDYAGSGLTGSCATTLASLPRSCFREASASALLM